MPALIVLQVISSSPGFSRKRLHVAVGVGLDQAVGRGFSTGVSTIVAFALRSRCSGRTAAQVDLRQHVAVEDDDRLGQQSPA